MQKMLAAVAMILMLTTATYAADYKVRAKMGAVSYNESLFMAHVQSLKLELEHRSGAYLFLEKDTVNRLGQTMDVDSVGIGGKIQVIKHLKVYGQIGYYKPFSNKDSFSRDLVYQQQLRLWGCQQVGGNACVKQELRYEVDIDPALGGEVGVEFSYPIYKSIILNISLGYRYLRMTEHLLGIRNDHSELGNIQDSNQDYGGKTAFIGVGYEF